MEHNFYNPINLNRNRSEDLIRTETITKYTLFSDENGLQGFAFNVNTSETIYDTVKLVVAYNTNGNKHKETFYSSSFQKYLSTGYKYHVRLYYTGYNAGGYSATIEEAKLEFYQLTPDIKNSNTIQRIHNVLNVLKPQFYQASTVDTLNSSIVYQSLIKIDQAVFLNCLFYTNEDAGVFLPLECIPNQVTYVLVHAYTLNEDDELIPVRTKYIRIDQKGNIYPSKEISRSADYYYIEGMWTTDRY